MWEGARAPKFLGHFLDKIEVRSAAAPNFSFRRLPWTSVSTYFVQFKPDDMWEGGPEAKVPGPLFSLN